MHRHQQTAMHFKISIFRYHLMDILVLNVSLLRFFLEISAFLRTGWLAVGSTDGYAHRHGTGVYVSAGPKRHEKRNGKKTQPSH